MYRLLLALCLFLASPGVRACSVASGYRVPTTLELVDEADAIVVAAPIGGTIDAKSGAVSFKTIYELKGPQRVGDGRPGYAVSVPGMFATDRFPATPSDPAELRRANPDAFTGACNRYVFDPNTWVLLFIKRDGTSYRVIDHPFARTREDAPGLNALWVQAVREYIAIAALPPAMRRARMEARQTVLRKRGDADSRAIADDIAYELNAPRRPLREPLPPVPE